MSIERPGNGFPENATRRKHEEVFKDMVLKLLQRVEDYQKEARMPTYILYTFSQGEIPYGSTTKNEYVPYDKPEVVSEYIDYTEPSKSVVVIKSQVDFRV